MSKADKFLTPVMRLVQGDCFEPQTKDQSGAPLTIKSGVNIGQPTQKYFVALAGSKTDPEVIALKAKFEAVARLAFPTLFPNPHGPCVNPQFSMKVIDGDGIDQSGKPNNIKEGFAGCWVFRFSSSYPPKCYAAGKYQPHEQLSVVGGVNPIPRGHYVRVAGTMSGNGQTQKPGLYVNLDMVEWARVGDVIISGPDASSVFGGGAVSGGSAGPQMTAKANGVPYASFQQQGWTDAALIADGYMLPAAPAPQAAQSVAPPPSTPSAPAAPSAVAPHATILTGPQMTAKANGVPYASFQQQGWTDAALIADGYMLPAAPAPQAAPAPLPPGGSAPTPPAPAQIAPAPTGVRDPQSRMLPAAGGITYAAYIAQNWTDALLIQNGFMSPQ